VRWQRAVKGAGGLVAQVTHAPQALRGSGLHGIQHRPDLLGRVRYQRVQGCTKRAAQAARATVRVSKIKPD